MGLEQLGWKSTFETEFSLYREQGFDPARVVAEHRDLFQIAGAFGVCAAETTGRLRHRAASREDLPVAGDWVAAAVRPEEGRASIHAVLRRATALVRKEAGDTTTAQVLAANVDTVFLVTSLNQDFNPRRIERTLALIWESGAQPVVVLNKADLCADPEAMREEAQAVAIGVPVHTISALTGAGMDEIQAHLAPGVTGVLLGSSGAGKSTIVNRLLGEEALAVHEIRSHDGRGRHTTTHRQLISLPRGGMLIDTPGLREVGLWLAGSGLDRTFADIEETAARCRFRDCRHETEPGCAVRAAMEEGSLDPDRYESYRKLERELAHLARQQDRRLKMQEVRRWKQITMDWRRRKKIEGRD